MARTRESEAMRWLSSIGVPVPEVTVVERADLDHLRLPFELPVVAKVDLSLGGKGSRGLVHRAETSDELRRALADLLDREVAGEPVTSVVVEEAVEGAEIYVSVSMDDVLGPVVRLAGRGGVGFDATSAASVAPGCLEPLLDHHLQDLVERAGITDRALAARLRHIIEVLWRAFVASEATLLELNPVRWDGSRAVAVGVALEFDDNARPAARAFWPVVEDRLRSSVGRAPTPRELAVAAASQAEPDLPAIAFVELKGDVASLVVGGGASLVCFDRLRSLGLWPACFADHSPGAGERKLQAIVEAGLRVPGVRGAVFGAVVISLADCAPYARALVQGVQAVGIDVEQVPIVARLAGPNEEEARKILAELPGLHVLGREATIEDACDLLAELLPPRLAVVR